MREIGLEELRKIQQGILDVVHEFCVKNQINYWLDSGTLLGCIRHKGYIPWDDDLDIGMLREDYDRFCKTFNGNYPYYEVVCIENNKNFYVPYAKIIDKRTYLKEVGHNLAVNIDLFEYDNAPDNDLIVKWMLYKKDLYERIYPYIYGWYKGKLKKEHVLKRIAARILCHIPNDFYIKLMVKNSKRYANRKTKRVGDFVHHSRNIRSKTLLSSFIEGEFEGKKYKIPIGYDEWLKGHFGDYMQLPPEEKRVSHHVFKAYYK